MILLALGFIELGFGTAAAWADTLPYSVRTHGYSAYSTTVRGDARSVGMAGANLGLSGYVLGTMDNPAGEAMTIGGIDLNFAVNFPHDSLVQNYDYTLTSGMGGLAMSLYPWGLGFGVLVPAVEGGNYSPVPVDYVVHELRLSGARVFWNNHLAVGLGLTLGQAVRDYGLVTNTGITAGGTVSMIAQLPFRLLLGADFLLPMTYGVDPSVPSPASLPGIFQPIQVPWRAGVGLGWVPNRFFRTDFSVRVVGPSDTTALLRDDSVLTGTSVTVQPHFGFAYNWIDYPEFSSNLFWGAYLESPRIQNASTRMHGTAGIEVAPWVFGAGAAIDAAYGYVNGIVFFGVNIIKIFTKLDLLPTPWMPPREGVFPSPFRMSDEGLPRPLVKNWKNQGGVPDVLEIGNEIPGRVRKKTQETVEEAKEIVQSIGEMPSKVSGRIEKRKKQ
ncbi:MAG: hypothetical protein ACXVBW_14090, partial [Bdellovibrionota bacterium]